MESVSATIHRCGQKDATMLCRLPCPRESHPLHMAALPRLICGGVTDSWPCILACILRLLRLQIQAALGMCPTSARSCYLFVGARCPIWRRLTASPCKATVCLTSGWTKSSEVVKPRFGDAGVVSGAGQSRSRVAARWAISKGVLA